MQNLEIQDWYPLGSVGQATAANKMYVTLRGEVEIRSLGFKQRSVSWDSFGAGRAKQSYLLYLPSYARNVTYTNVTCKRRTIQQRQTMKQKTLIILTMGILSTLFGCGQNNKTEGNDIFPKESFSVVEAKIGDKPVIGSFNMAYKTYDKKEKYPWCLKIAIGLDLENLFENGLPKNEESAIAKKLEDELLAEIQKLTTAHYIGHLFNDTFLDVYIYLDDPEKVHNYLQTQVNKEGLIRGFGYEINQDPKWTTVEAFLK